MPIHSGDEVNVGSEKTSKLNMVNEDGYVPQDLDDEKVCEFVLRD